MDRASLVENTERPFSIWEAMYWDSAVWMEPAHSAKQMPNTGWIILDAEPFRADGVGAENVFFGQVQG